MDARPGAGGKGTNMKDEHIKRFSHLAARKGFENLDEIGREYGAALYLLSVRPGLYEETRDYIGFDGIDFDRMLRQADLSGGEHTVVRLAWQLFNGGALAFPVLPLDLCCALDDDLFACCLTAMEIRRRGLDALSWRNK